MCPSVKDLVGSGHEPSTFHFQMPPVDRLYGFGRTDSAGKRYGFTTYDEDDIPRTEL